jgi:sigma-E factor negative regulatory protein RseC
MANVKTDIRHKGFVKEIRDNSLFVNIVNESACSACHAKGVCNVADYQNKEIEITNFTGIYSTGQEVTIIFQESKGFTALFFGYILPFLVVLLALITAISVTGNELTSGLFSLAVLIPYYITLYFFRHYLKKVFKFELEEMN